MTEQNHERAIEFATHQDAIQIKLQTLNCQVHGMFVDEKNSLVRQCKERNCGKRLIDGNVCPDKTCNILWKLKLVHGALADFRTDDARKYVQLK